MVFQKAIDCSLLSIMPIMFGEKCSTGRWRGMLLAGGCLGRHTTAVTKCSITERTC